MIIIRRMILIIRKYFRYIKYKNTLPRKLFNSDLYIVEYPKSGITWLSTIIANTCFTEDGLNVSATHFNLEQYVADIHKTKVIPQKVNYPYFRIIKSHDSYNPYYRHVIYLLRNPFSVMNSYFYYLKNNKKFKGSRSEFIRSPKYGIKQWVHHVQSWLNPKNVLKLHLLRYEDLINNPNNTIGSLYTNLGLDVDKLVIKNVIEKSSFINMKKLNNLYKVNCPFRQYDFVREGKTKATLDDDADEYIYNQSVCILKDYYPELVRK
jgi:hypothetical protein